MNANGIDFKTCHLSEPGVFIENKGCFVFQEMEHFAFWLVIDGEEFLPKKSSAELIVEQLCADLSATTALSREYLKKCLSNAHTILKNGENGIRLRASLALVVTDYSEIIWAVSGNSRVYLIRDGQLAFRSQDQTKAQSLLESEIITEESMNYVADRDVLTNYLGIEFGFAPLISKRFQLQNGDIIILCNMGFWEQLKNDTFNQLPQNVTDPTELLPTIEKKYLDKKSEALNYYIVGLVAVRSIISRSNSDKLRLPFEKKQLAFVLTLLLIGGGIIYTGIIFNTKLQKESQLKEIQILTQKNTIAEYEQKGDLLVKEGKFAEAMIDYNQALNILKICIYKDTEENIRKKVSIVSKLKDGDDFFDKGQYEKALSHYEAAQNYDTRNFFLIQTLNKIENVRKLLNAKSAAKHHIPSPSPTKHQEPIVVHKEETPVEASPKIVLKPKTVSSPDQTFSKNPVKTPAKTPVKILTKTQTLQEKTHKPVSGENGSSKNTTTTKGNAKVVIKSNESGKSSNDSNKNTTKNTVNPEVLSKLNKAEKLVAKGDELANRKKYRRAISCYKKARKIYLKLSIGKKAKQLSEKIEITERKKNE